MHRMLCPDYESIVVIVALMIVELMIVVGMSCRKYIGAGDSSGIEL